jgi:hypothetical protein
LTNEATVALLKAYLPSGWSLEEEMSLLAVQTPEKQRVVEKRLAVIDRFLREGATSAEDVKNAATEIGVKRRQFYVLLAKCRELGPTRALTPGLRKAGRASPSRDGLPGKAEEKLQQILAENPEEKVGRIQALLKTEMGGEADELPGESAIRSRIHALRRLRVVPTKDALFGADITVDQVAMDLSIKEDDRNVWAIITLIFDRSTRIILGFGLTGSDTHADGLKQATADCRARLQGIYDSRIPIASDLISVRWIKPESDVIVDVGDIPKQFEPIAAGRKRHGEAILRLLGDQLPPFAFRRAIVLGDQPLTTEKVGMDLGTAHRLVEASVDRWNASIVARSATSVQMPDSVRHRRLQAIANVLSDVFGRFYEVTGVRPPVEAAAP